MRAHVTVDAPLLRRSVRSAGRARGRLLSRVRLPAVLLVAVVAGFYAWTASVGTADNHDLQYYDNLADALVHGRLDLRPSPPPGLLALPDPYDPGASQPYRDMGFHDLILYKGRFYSAWGPAPALVLFAPLRLVGIDMSHAIAAFVLGFGAWLFAAGALLFVVRRWLPSTPRWMLYSALLLVAAGDIAPFLLRRPKVYEVAIISGLCFSMGAVYFLMSGAFGERVSGRRLALGSLCVGLALLSRPQMGVELLAIALLGVWLWRRRSTLGVGWAAALLVPAGACLALLGAYNAARFGSPFAAGQESQLSALNAQTLNWGSLSYVLPGLYYLLLNPPHLDWVVPFTGQYSILVPRGAPVSLPAGFSDPGVPIGGLLPMAPVVVLLFALPWIRVRAGGAYRELRASIATMTGLAVVLLLALAYLIFPVERYAGDFTGLLVLAAAFTWLLATRLLADSPRARRAVQVGGVALAAWTIVAGVVMSAPATIGH